MQEGIGFCIIIQLFDCLYKKKNGYPTWYRIPVLK